MKPGAEKWKMSPDKKLLCQYFFFLSEKKKEKWGENEKENTKENRKKSQKQKGEHQREQYESKSGAQKSAVIRLFGNFHDHVD